MENVAVPVAAPELEADQPYLVEHGSVVGKMVARLLHTHPLYQVNNATGYTQLVSAMLDSSYASTIATFKRTKNDRGALLYLRAQFDGPAHWNREV